MTQPSFSLRQHHGDDRPRKTCDRCGFIDYQNPRMVVGSVVTYGERYLLCRRAIEPCKGRWTIPAGFLEQHETPEAGARREALEEAEAVIEIDGLLAVYTVPHISQVQLIYRAHLPEPSFAAGFESLEVALYDWEEIPWDRMAFPSGVQALRHHHQRMGQPLMQPFTRTFEQRLPTDTSAPD